MTVLIARTRWIPLGTLILIVAVAIMAGACNGGRPGSTEAEPPFQGLDQLVELSDLSIIGKVEAVSELQTMPLPSDPTSQVEYLEATVEVDRILFGSYHSRVVAHVPVYYLTDNGHRMVTKAPVLESGQTVMLFLTKRSSLFDLDSRDFMITGGAMLWGKLAVEGERVSAPYPESESIVEPLDEVTAWIEAARLFLAKPGLLAGEISGLDDGDEATIRLLKLGPGDRLENGVLVDEWALSNGPWEQEGLRLSQGTYILVPEAEDYLPVRRIGGLMFEVPTEGVDWRERNLGFAFFRPKDADDKPLSSGTGWIPERSVGGWIVGLPEGVVGTVRIQRLPPVPNELYVIGGPPLPEDTPLYVPQELTCLEALEEAEDHLVPEETVAEIEVGNGRWGLSDHSLAGHRYLITLQTSDMSGIRVGNSGYVAVIFGGNAAHLLRGVDFYVGDAALQDWPTAAELKGCHLIQIKEEAVRSLFDSSGRMIDPNKQIAEIARDHEGGFGGFYFHETDKGIVYVYMLDVTKTAAAEAAFRAAYKGDREIAQIIPVQGDYSLDQLVEWYYTLTRAFSASDIDWRIGAVHERDNRIYLGLRHEDQISDARRVMERLGIPEGAVILVQDYMKKAPD